MKPTLTPSQNIVLSKILFLVLNKGYGIVIDDYNGLSIIIQAGTRTFEFIEKKQTKTRIWFLKRILEAIIYL